MKITVIGSLNMDLVVRVERAPKGGETISGSELRQICGGKGANQAVAIGKLNCDVRMAGVVGDDAFGKELMANLERNHVGTDFVHTAENTASGTAMIVVEENGENRIIISPGANGKVRWSDVRSAVEEIEAGDICLLQFEIPSKTVFESIRQANEKGATVVFNPAPMKPIPDEILACVNYLITNETETEMLTGIPSDTEENIRRQSEILLAKGVSCAIITLGDKGAFYNNGSESRFVPGFEVTAVDTTGAGDAFIAGLCYGLMKQFSLEKCVSLGSVAGAITVTRLGAQSSLPSEQEIMFFAKQAIICLD